MNEFNDLESLLASWKPRRPSDRLEARIFHRPAEGPFEGDLFGFLRPRLAFLGPWFLASRPALATAAMMLLLGALFSGEHWAKSAPAEKNSMLVALSNQTWAAFLGMADLHRNFPPPILGWTKQEHLPSTTRSLDELSTNFTLPKL